ncbi:MAG: energy transducer TonB [Taibaiella sp.]|nr:energy transducer TonB [Taibaiella sp.]
MNKISLLLLCCTVSLSAGSFAQEKKKKDTPPKEIPASVVNADIDAPPPPKVQAAPPREEVFVHVEEMPSFPGGSDKMYAFLQKHKKYPQKAPDSELEGKVFVGFIIKSDGSIENIEIKRSLSPSHDAEAIRLIKMMPKWIPGKQNGRAVNCWYTLPIDFYFLR